MTGHDNDKNTSKAARPVISIDYERYEHYLDDSDLSPEQKREFLAALWSIICEFVALGFNVHPLQQVREACGKPYECRTSLPISDPDAVELRDQFNEKDFRKAAGRETPRAAERIQE